MSSRPWRRYATQHHKLYARYRVRCRYCWARRTFTMKPENYIKLPHCGCRRSRRARATGKRDVWWIDWHRTAKFEAKATTCYCLGNPHPHRRGSHYPSLGARCDYAASEQ